MSQTKPRPFPANPTIGDVIALRLGRRDLLKASLATTVLAASGTLGLAACKSGGGALESFPFAEINHGVSADHVVAEGHKAQILLRWGDPLFANAPAFDPAKQTAAAQERQFGYNNDYIGFIPLGTDGQRGLLCVNHEYTVPELMFPDVAKPEDYRADHAAIELAAHGISIVEIVRNADGTWTVQKDSRYNRRISGYSTICELSGPVAGDVRVSTNAEPFGRKVIGTLNNCAGGVTPWDTYLSGEENFDRYFHHAGDLDDAQESANLIDYGVGPSDLQFWKFFDRFDVAKEPKEPNRFGWIVEVDPLDPTASPKKRTALGRLKHEGAETIVAKDGRLVVYSGDDEMFQCLYRFVSSKAYDPKNRAANRDLLDEGTLSVARFNPDGTLTWMPLKYGEGPLLPANSFNSQVDVLIEARRAAGMMGGTPLDRPEDVQPHPTSGRVYVMLTNNRDRTPEQIDPANPRANNRFGHILELTTPDGDHAANKFTWDILLQCGHPNDPEVAAVWNKATSGNGWFASPDNCAVDGEGRLWVATDQGKRWSDTMTADGLYGVETVGPARGAAKMFYRVPVGAELCGPCFTPDSKTLFLSVQHPAADLAPDSADKVPAAFRGKPSYATPATRWPDFNEKLPPRPSVVIITQKSGGPVGT